MPRNEQGVKYCRPGRHLKTPENTYIRPCDGSKVCRQCRREGSARWDASPAGRASHQKAWARYNNSTAGLVRTARQEMRRRGAAA